MSEEDLNTYKKYVSNLDITKYIVLDSKSNYWYSAEYVDKMLKKQDKEIKRLNNIIKEALRKLRATKDHYKMEDINNAIIHTIKILERSDKVE